MDGKHALDIFTKYTRINLRVIGLWPESREKDERLPDFQFFISTIVFFFSTYLPQVAELFKIWGNVELTSEILATAVIPYTVSFIKIIILWYNRKQVKVLFASVVKDWENKKTIQELEIMTKNGKTSQKLALLCLAFGQAAINTRVLQICYRNWDAWKQNDENVTHTLYVMGYFPYDWNQTPRFEITCVIEYIGTFLATLGYCGTDGFYAQLGFHFSGQYNILRMNLLNIITDTNNEISYTDFDNKLSHIVQAHRRINRSIEIMEKTFNLMFLGQLMACSFQFCVQGYQLVIYWTEKNSKSIVFDTIYILVFFINIMINMFIYCYVAELLQTESFKFAQAAFDCKWYDLPPKKIKNLLLIIQRGKKPVELTAGKFFIFNLQLFGKILKTSLGYLSVLLQMKQSHQ